MRVLKPITTPMHHFPAGAEIAAGQLDGPLTVEDWQRLGHLEAPASEPAPAPAPAKASKAAPAPTEAAPRESD
jgi:hypothetical protein